MSGRPRIEQKKGGPKLKRDSSRSLTRRPPATVEIRSKSKSPSRVQKSPKKPKTPIRSPARKSPARKSPVRKSPARKSPARKSSGRQSPARPSPSRESPSRVRGRPRKHPTPEKKTVIKIKTSTPVIDNDTDSDGPLESRIIKNQTQVRGRTRRLDLEREAVKDVDYQDKNNIGYYEIIRRTIRTSQSREKERVVHLKTDTFTKYEQKLTEFSDEDDIPLLKKPIDSIESRPSRKEFVTEYGGWFGAIFLILFVPFEVIFLNMICNETECAYKLPSIRYKDVSLYLDVYAFAGFTVYLALIAIISAIPFGGPRVAGMFNRSGKLEYVMNGTFTTFMLHLILVCLEFAKIPIVNLIYAKYLQVVVSAVLLGILLSIYFYARSFLVPVSALNPKGDTNSHVYNFFMGRQTNPKILNVDAKIYLLRVLHISVVVLNSVFLCKSLGLNSSNFKEYTDIKELNINFTMLTILGTLYICFMDGIIHENTWTTTYEVQNDGVGYLLTVSHIALPFTYAVIPKYIYEHRVNLQTWQLIASIVIFIIGYILFRGSNNQKHAFRKNPYSPSVAHFETIPTSQGKKLLVSGFWGLVRHPNYLGDIIIHLSFLFFVVCVPPAITCFMAVIILINRAQSVELHCKHKYEAAWDRYCQRVKKILIPKVY